MELNGCQRQQFQKALLSAFPKKAKLEQMLDSGLDWNLDAIAGGQDRQDLSDIIFNLIKYAETHGKLSQLLSAARKANDGNPTLSKFALLNNKIDAQNSYQREDVQEAENIEHLVRQFRQQVAPEIQKRCGVTRILDMTQPIDSTMIYTDVDILERVTSKTRGKLEKLRQGMGPDDCDRFCLGQVKQKRMPGMEALRQHKLLMILGKPGAGKTTFLKRLAMGCRAGQCGLADRVPFFVSLKEFADDEGRAGSLLQFVEVGYELAGENSSLESLLKAGRSLVLLDGLDEVQEAEQDRVLREIHDFAHRYNKNQIVITCRIAAKEYIFERFTEVEVADFNDEQIQDFANKWFKARETEQIDEEERSTIAQEFWWVLQENEPVRELANNPLLLTLLVLEFSDSFEFPSSRSELHERGLNVLLSKWDGSRRIRREEIYKKLPIKRKKRLLAQLAWATFEKGDYFFKQKVAEAQIQQYIQNLPGVETDEEALLVDSGLVLRAIEAQHGLLTQRAAGIYSFSHLTFHEYFAASQIAESTELQRALSSKIFELRWREVFLLVSEQLLNAGVFLLAVKREIDALICNQSKIQDFLFWGMAKSKSAISSNNLSALRAAYNYMGLSTSSRHKSRFNSEDSFSLVRTIRSNIARSRTGNIAVALSTTLGLKCKKGFIHINNLNDAIAFDVDLDARPKSDELKQAQIESYLKQIRIVIDSTQKSFCQPSAQDEKFRQAMIECRNIGHNWQFTEEQLDLLEQYYKANHLLIQCLNTECNVSREVRQEIEDTLLLPYDEIQKYKAAKT